MLSADTEPIVTQVASHPGCLDVFLRLLRFAQMIRQVWRASPGDDLARGCHGDDVRTVPLREIRPEEVLVLLVDNNSSIFSESPNMVTTGVLLNFENADLLNQISQNRSQLLFLFPGEGIVPGHLAGPAEVDFLVRRGAFAAIIFCAALLLG